MRDTLKLYKAAGTKKEIAALYDDLKALEDIRSKFKAAVDNAARNKVQSGEGKTNSLSTKDDVAQLKKMSYNQYRSEKMSFEYGSAPTGTQRMFFNSQQKQFEIWEKGDDTIVSMGIAKPGKEAERLYERVYGRYDSSFYGNAESIESSKGKDIWNSEFPENRKNDAGNGRTAQSERGENDTGRSGANLPEGNNEKSITNEPLSDDGGFSLQKSTKDTEYLELAKDPVKNENEAHRKNS